MSLGHIIGACWRGWGTQGRRSRVGSKGGGRGSGPEGGKGAPGQCESRKRGAGQRLSLVETRAVKK